MTTPPTTNKSNGHVHGWIPVAAWGTQDKSYKTFNCECSTEKVEVWSNGKLKRTNVSIGHRAVLPVRDSRGHKLTWENLVVRKFYLNKPVLHRYELYEDFEPARLDTMIDEFWCPRCSVAVERKMKVPHEDDRKFEGEARLP
ncbi:MAG: hypothetical protein OK422_04410 [Thaumarchaeota archaeon]|nr:hypothetical protein [Nitrososphaerota archaeon]